MTMRFPPKHPIKNYIDGSGYYLVPATEVHASDSVHRVIAEICNEQAVFDYLFRSALGDGPYSVEMARGFLEWSKAGWESEQYYVFFIMNKVGDITGCITIKSNDLECAEIGYWCSKNHPGVMTNTVMALCSLAQANGFRRFDVRVKTVNQRSAAVLIRAGFSSNQEKSKTDTVFHFYLRKLQ